MKKITASIIAAAILLLLLGSCVSLQDRPITAQESVEFSTVGTVTMQYTTFRGFNLIGNGTVKKRAYTQLLAEAQKQYGNEVDVRNIQMSGNFSGWELFYSIAGIAVPTAILTSFNPHYPIIGALNGIAIGGILGIIGHFQKITATADVVRRGVGVAADPVAQTNPQQTIFQRLEVALDKASLTLIDEMQRDATIAILSVSSNDRDMASYAMDELEYKLVRARRFQIVDRRQLEQIRAEQNFQLSGEVSDASAVSIGNMLGASIVITGDISSFGTIMRLSLRAIDVRTARILTIAREQF